MLPDGEVKVPPAPVARVQQRMLYLAVFASGMTTLAVELSASRLLGNVFGTSNLVWANIIGLILIYLTVGYFIGGRWADWAPRFELLYRIIIWGAFASGLVPLVGRPVLTAAATAVAGFDAGVAVGSFIAILILFAIPVTLLGCVSPFALRLSLNDVKNSGKTAGRMYAISTLGSILGTFAPVLYLIPELGTTQTFEAFSLVLLLVGLLGLAMQNRRGALRLIWLPFVLIALTIWALNGPLRPPPPGMSLIYEKDSAYNYIQVVQYPDRDNSVTRLLLLNEGQGIHSEWNSSQAYFARTWDFFMAAPFFNAPPYTPTSVKRLCVIGLAAGTIANQYTQAFGGLLIDGIEIDPAIVDAGRRYFAMTDPNLHVIVQDGRLALHQSSQMYDVVAVDAYRVPYVPWNLTTVEFFQDVAAHLTSSGVVAINVGRTMNNNTGQEDRRLVEAMTHTMAAVFPTIWTIDVPGSFNTILVATRQPTSQSNLAANLAGLPGYASPILKAVLTSAVQNVRPTVQSTVLFTDDRAPVETIVDSMVINFLTGGGAGQFQK